MKRQENIICLCIRASIAHRPPNRSSSTNSCIYEFFHPSSMPLCIHHTFIHPSIIEIPIHPTVHLSIHPSIIQMSTHPFTSPMNPSSVYPTVHLANYVFIHHPSCLSVVDTVLCCSDPLAMKDFLPQLLGVLVSKSR